jgi:WD40 repeat protein
MWPVFLLLKIEKQNTNWPQNHLLKRIAMLIFQMNNPVVIYPKKRVKAFCFLKSKGGFVTANQEGTLSIFQNDESILEIQAFETWLHGLVLFQDTDNSIVCISNQCYWKKFRIETGTCMEEKHFGYNNYLSFAAISPGCKYFAVDDHGKRLEIRKTSASKWLIFAIDNLVDMRFVMFASDQIVIVGTENNIQLWDVEKECLFHSLTYDSDFRGYGYFFPKAFLNFDKTLLCILGDESKFRIWDLQHPQQFSEKQKQGQIEHEVLLFNHLLSKPMNFLFEGLYPEKISHFTISKDGKRFACIEEFNKYMSTNPRYPHPRERIFLGKN